MSSSEARTRGVDAQDLELFTTAATDPTPERHPSVLRPGGHASPLNYPTVLRPGAGRQGRTPSPNANPKTPPQHSPYKPPSTQPVTYKAYSPPRVQSPSDELSAEIEGYFTALEVAPLNIKKQGGTPEPSVSPIAPPPTRPVDTKQDDGEDDLYVRCASPPVPPKERIEEDRHQVVSPISELEAPVERIEEATVVSPVVSEPEPKSHGIDSAGPSIPEPPPAYDESERVTPPPEKTAAPSSPRRSGDGGLAGSAAASAAQIGSALAGVHANEAIETSSLNLTDPLVANSEGKDDNKSNATAATAPPPLPPRQKPSSPGKGKKPASPSNTPAAAKPATGPYKAGGAAATSAANVGAAVVGLAQNPSLKEARKVLGKGLGHLIDKAKEHHQHLHEHHQQKKEKEQKGHSRKSSKERKETSAPRGGAEDSYLSMKAEGDYYA